jgi:hypothetical protein
MLFLPSAVAKNIRFCFEMIDGLVHTHNTHNQVNGACFLFF